MKDNVKMLSALLTGAVVGTVAGVLFAPDKGSKTRKKIADTAERLADTVKEKAGEAFDNIKARVS